MAALIQIFKIPHFCEKESRGYYCSKLLPPTDQSSMSPLENKFKWWIHLVVIISRKDKIQFFFWESAFIRIWRWCFQFWSSNEWKWPFCGPDFLKKTTIDGFPKLTINHPSTKTLQFFLIEFCVRHTLATIDNP